MSTEVFSNVKKFYSRLLDIFEEGRRSGELKPDLNPRLARDIFVGTMDHIITRWLLKDMSYSLFEGLDPLFDLMVGAFIAEPSRTPSPAESQVAAAAAAPADVEWAEAGLQEH
jgi:TetR/AcrR family fatty acid metabolism transcriptional regulator